MTRPPAWSLTAGHPDLCPGSDRACLHRGPFGARGLCPVCDTPVWSYPWPSGVGGGRVEAHYRPSLFDEVGP